MKRGTLILVVVVVLAGLVGVLVASIFHNGLSARATPTLIEKMMARDARRLAIPAAARDLRNPVPASAEMLVPTYLLFRITLTTPAIASEP